MQLRPFNADHREAHQPAKEHQQVFGDGGDGVSGSWGQIQMLQQGQLQQRREVPDQLGGDDEDQNGNQDCAERNRLQTLHALYRRGYIPEGDVLQEAKRRMNFRPQEDNGEQGDQHQDGSYQPQ